MKLPAKLPTAAITALIDTREQRPLTLPGLRTEPATLPTGDYSVKGLESHIAIERKSLPDLLMCVGRERLRFDKEIQRLLGYRVRALVVEATWQDVEAARWRSRLNSRQVGSSLVSWVCRGIPVLMVGDHARAGRIVSSLLRRAAIHRWRELRQFANSITDPSSQVAGDDGQTNLATKG